MRRTARAVAQALRGRAASERTSQTNEILLPQACFDAPAKKKNGKSTVNKKEEEEEKDLRAHSWVPILARQKRGRLAQGLPFSRRIGHAK